ncbi:Macrolide export ATP-binding/permease protein MacB [uncultured Clostridium sp.]|uniref:ABC transporter permease n=1 Tax=uncultured Clostridium sp. TaxID=59620 RepID=UPI000820E894|nr:ABC transporter permease [uncultured Clostridium sp.]SCK04423.1 Macrolide export ATP-binding/permease protein MacB [uncultured Clostridium sp.]
MRFSEMIKLVFKNLLQNKSKVILTSLGIIAGAATVVAVIAIGKGGEEEVKAQFSGLSAETIYVNPDYSNGVDILKGNFTKLTTEHMDFIINESTALQGIYIRGSSYKEAVINNVKENVSVTGVTEQYSKVSNLKVAYGYDIDRIDIEDETSVVVIGNGIANKYFMGPEDALGKEIRIGNRNYKIIGVLERSADGMQGLSPDDTAFIPYSTAQNNIFDEFTIPQIVGLAKKIDFVKLAMAEIMDSLNYILEDDNIYTVEDAGSRIDAASESARTMNVLLISIAAIVFIVGGIGIMNVLFLSVKERTKEIGILKALGATEVNIMALFILEAVLISGFGGIIGVILSNYFIQFIKYLDVPTSTSIEGQAIAFTFAIVTGTVFGFYPAYKASQLKPVDALNYE